MNYSMPPNVFSKMPGINTSTVMTGSMSLEERPSAPTNISATEGDAAKWAMVNIDP